MPQIAKNRLYLNHTDVLNFLMKSGQYYANYLTFDKVSRYIYKIIKNATFKMSLR